MSRIVVREAALGERDRILRIALTEPNAGMQQARQVCQMTQSYLQRCGGSVGALHLAESAGHVLTVCAALDLPGRVSLLVVPPWSLAKSSLGVLPDVLAAGSAAADQRGMRFAQILLDPELSWRIEPYLLAVGFSHLASLDYMQRNAFDPVVIRPVEQVVWRTLPEAGEVALADVILHTYIGSRDCPALTGIRTMEEILASHRGAGEFDPDGWYLLQHRGRDVGVLLTARTVLRPTLEVVYCGLVPEARGQGLGRLCVHKAILRARDLARPLVTLAVDAANTPARRTYEAMGFAAYSTRDVWIRVFRRADQEGHFALPSR